MFPPKAKTFLLIVVDGEKPAEDFLRYWSQRAQALFAADGAADWCLKNGINPDAVVGDMDSFSLTHPAIFRQYDQNNNDLEKTIIHAIKNGFSNVVILGAFGKRADHFLTNIHVLKKYSLTITLFFVHHDQMAFMCPAQKYISMTLKNNDFLSLVPLDNDTGPITTSGLKYPLHNEKLSFLQRLGTLNRVTDSPVTLYCDDAHLLIIAPYHSDLTILTL